MMITRLENNELISLLQRKALDERKLTLEIIDLLEEVERRSLHLEKGYGSLLEFCIKELKYSESSAYRRISAMRVAKEIPQIKKSIESGKLNLVNVTQAQTFFKQEKKYLAKSYSKAEKLAVLESLEDKSKREAEKILIQKSPDLPKVEMVKQISENQARLTLTIDQSLVDQLDFLKNRYSHVNPNPTYAELISLMAADLLKKDGANSRSRSDSRSKSDSGSLGLNASSQQNQHVATPPVKIKHSRFISRRTKNFVFQRDQGGCSYQNLMSGQRCGSKFQLEIDHIQPFSKGGTNELENLRLVCRQHNQYLWRFVQSGQSV